MCNHKTRPPDTPYTGRPEMRPGRFFDTFAGLIFFPAGSLCILCRRKMKPRSSYWLSSFACTPIEVNDIIYEVFLPRLRNLNCISVGGIVSRHNESSVPIHCCRLNYDCLKLDSFSERRIHVVVNRNVHGTKIRRSRCQINTR